MKRLAYILISCALVLAVLEIACRTLLADRVPRAFVSTLAFEHDPLLGWFPVPDSAGEFEGSRKISIRHNHHGFRDRERSAEKSLPRVAFLGDSFVWGYDVEREDRFTELLQGHVPDYEIVNLGVAGYGTAQELLLLEREFDFFEPDLVFLIVSGNDRNDNSSNKGYSAYRPYFSRDGDALRRAGVPVPIAPSYAHKSSWLYHRSALVRLVAEIRAERLHPPQRVRDPSEELIVAIHRFLAQRNAKLAIGLILPDAGLWSVCEREEIPCLDLSEIGPQHRFPSHGRHWTETGHRRVSYLVFDFLVERGLIRTGTGVAPR